MKKLLINVAIVGVLGACLAGCGGSSDTEDTSSAPAAGTEAGPIGTKAAPGAQSAPMTAPKPTAD
jgi:hypothetical protein